MSRLLAALLVIVIPQLAAAQDKEKPKAKAKAARPAKPPAYTRAADAGPDFAVQGEYAGRSQEIGKIGMQVVARGDGKFFVRGLKGGLPGDGWDGTTRKEFLAETADGKITFEGSGVRGEYTAGRWVVTGEKETVTLEKVERTSPTLGQKPPAGAVVLFDGRSAGEWVNGKIVEENLLDNGTTSKKKFQDFTLHVEIRTPFMPKAAGQSRGNSGVYLQGRYEVQVLDSFGLAGKNNECGGLYELADPIVNMCLPPLTWQTYDIDYTAARYDAEGKKINDAIVTVRHNGVVVQDAVKLPRATRANVTQEGAEAGPIHLQNHGDPVHYRNIWVVERPRK